MAEYRNPAVGGYYKITYDPDTGRPLSELNIALPLAGADIANRVIADLPLADAFAIKVNAKYNNLQILTHVFQWFFNNNNGDYVGRPDNAGMPTMQFYNGVQDTGNNTGLGAVITGTAFLFECQKRVTSWSPTECRRLA